MRKNRSAYIVYTALLTMLPGQIPAQESANLTPGITENAVYYRLPATRLTVKVQAVRTTYTPGELSRYASRYLRMDNINAEPYEQWTITDISLECTGIPDNSMIYSLEFAGHGSHPTVRLTADGVLLAVNCNPAATSKTGTSADKSVKGNPAGNTDPRSFLTEEILMAGSTAKMAELTAREIYSIRESRNAITRGQAEYIPSDGESLKYVLEQLDEQEKALTGLFTGTTVNEEQIFTFNVDPTEPVSKQILFRFSSRMGVLPKDNLAGEPVWIDIDRLGDIASDNPVNAITESNKGLSFGKQAFLFFKIPGSASVKVYDNRRTYLEAEPSVAQFGETTALPRSLFGKGETPQITFSTVTGAIETIAK